MSTEDFQAELEAVRAKYCEGCRHRIEEVRVLATRWLDQGHQPSAVSLLRAVHRLCASSSGFGFPQTAADAADVEERVRTALVSPEESGRVGVLPALHRLYDTVDTEIFRTTEPPESGAPAPPPSIATDSADLIAAGRRKPAWMDHRPLIAFLSEGTEARFGLSLCEVGFRTEVSQVDPRRSFAVIGTLDEHEAAKGETSVGLPTVVHRIALVPSESFHHRLRASRAGAGAILVEPVDEDQLVEAVDEIRRGIEDSPPRLVVVDDEANIALELAQILEAEGMLVRWLTNPSEVLDVVRDFRPDVVLTDLQMPYCDGFEVAAVLRQDPALVYLPVIFMAGDPKHIDHHLAFRNEGDAVLGKQEKLDVVIELIRNKTIRARRLEASMTTDSLTGLLRHTSFKDRLDVELGRCRRQGEELACAMVDIDRFKQVNDRYGHDVGDRVIQGLSRLLRRRLRSTDLVGRYGGEEFAIALPNTSLSRAEAVLNDLRTRFHGLAFTSPRGSLCATFSAGIASFPEFDRTESILRAADEALYSAKRSGRDRVQLRSSCDPAAVG